MNPSDVTLEREEQLVQQALSAARDTRFFAAKPGIRHQTAQIFGSIFGSSRAIIVADPHTFAAAGRDVQESFVRENRAPFAPFLFGDDVYADYPHVEELVAALRAVDAIPVAVGSGTINDLTKLAAHMLGRPYLVVGTAASMDGYAAFGASILRDGSKDTIDCPGPRAILADLDAVVCAPVGMNASGYGDLIAKVVGGADWILADAAGVEAIQPAAWETVQGLLRAWVGSPDAVAANDAGFLCHLLHGLVMSGFAMQATLSSRPASGAEHQFSHLWDMQHHTFQGVAPSHGFKVGIGTLASLGLHQYLLGCDLQSVDVERAVRAWPSMESLEGRIRELFGPGAMAQRALDETRAKYVSGERLRLQLQGLCGNWPELREKLREQLMPFDQLRDMLRRAGCPITPEQIGISRARLRLAYQQCCFMRRRFTILDCVLRLGLMEGALDHMFGPQGCWKEQA